jgi:hypothetical protein
LPAAENLARRPSPFMTTADLRWLEDIRMRYGPHDRCRSWPGTP